MSEMMESTEARNEATFELMKEKQKRMDDKLANVEETETVLDYVKTEVRKVSRDLSDKITANSQQFDARFKSLIADELTYEDVVEEEDGTVTGLGLLFGKDVVVDDDGQGQSAGEEGEEGE